jgi:hypothetical protein
MRSGSKAASIAVVIAGALTLTLCGPLPLETAAAAAPSPTLIKSAHVAFENCPARTTILRVTMLNLFYVSYQSILVGISVRNTSGTACGHTYLPRSVALPNLGLQIGPCGSVSMVVKNALGQEVFPGPGDAPSCPQHYSVRLPAHHSLTTVAVWSQQLGLNGQGLVPRGIYRIIIDKKIVFHLTLTDPGGPIAPGTSHPTPPPPGPCGSFFDLVASTSTTTPGPKCPIGQVAPPTAGSTPTPTVQPTTPTTNTTEPTGRQATTAHA